MKVAITGAGGLVGGALSRALTADGHAVVHLVRRPARTAAEARWDPGKGTVDTGPLTGADAVVHLAGEPIGPARWTRAKTAAIWDSRISGTAVLVRALLGMEHPPPRLVSGSAVGFYGDTAGRPTGEDGPNGTGFLPRLARDWEAAAQSAAEGPVSVALSRTGIVLAGSGGMLGTVLPLFRAGLGGRLGTGRQYMSWIALDDMVAALRLLIERTDLTGPFNLTAPNPVTNASYTAAVAHALHRPALAPVPAFAIRAALGGFADEAALVDQRVVPDRLNDAGFTFAHPELTAALPAVLRQ
ncbi:TIGR01777 family oxidoreductase [Nocardiopsis coralliicola]